MYFSPSYVFWNFPPSESLSGSRSENWKCPIQGKCGLLEAYNGGQLKTVF